VTRMARVSNRCPAPRERSGAQAQQCSAAAPALPDQATRGDMVRFDVSKSELDLLCPRLAGARSGAFGPLAAVRQSIAELDYEPLDDAACHYIAVCVANLIDFARMAGVTVAPVSIALAALLLEYRTPPAIAVDLIDRFETQRAAQLGYAMIRLVSPWVMLIDKTD
jgi:hypothetical protein